MTSNKRTGKKQKAKKTTEKAKNKSQQKKLKTNQNVRREEW
jgi:hypothetical protein